MVGNRGVPAEAGPPGTPVTPGPRRRRRRRRRHKRLVNKILLGLGILAVTLAIYVLVLVLRLGQATTHLRQAKVASEKAATALQQEDVASARADLKRASDEFVRARNLLSAIEVKAARKIPVVGPNVKVAAAIAVAGAKVAEAGTVVLERARVLEDENGRLKFPYEGGKVDLEKVRSLEEPVSEAAESVALARSTLEGAPTSTLLGSVSSAREEFLERITEVDRRLQEAAVYLEVAPELLGAEGRKTYLVAIGNNAEMNSGGMVLAYGFVEADRGSLSFGHVGSVTELDLDTPVSVAQEPAFYARWSWANPNFAWQRVNVSIDPEASGSLMAAMVQAKTGRPVDGVVYLDGVAISYLLDATGPLRFYSPNVLLDASNFADYTMNRAYFEFSSQSERKEFLVEAAARAIEAAFQIRGAGSEKLASGMARGISEGRIWVWAADSDVQSKLARVALGGKPQRALAQVKTASEEKREPPGDIVSYSLINLAGNKVDYYIHNTITHRVVIEASGEARASVEFEIENRAPTDLPEYVGGSAGPNQAQRSRGEYLGYLTWYAPLGSELLDGGELEVQSTLPDGGLSAFSWSVKVAPGDRQTVRFEYRIPQEALWGSDGGPRSYVLVYRPQPRIRPDRFSSELVFEGSGGVEPVTGYSKGDGGKLYYSDSPSTSTRLEAVVKFPER